MPAWDSYSYMFYGSRHFLDMEYHQGNRDMLKEVPGPADSYRDNILDGNHYWGLAIACCQTRGSLWILRDKVFPAALGGDSNVERSYFSDQITENGNYYLRWVDWKDGPGNTEITTSIMPPDFAGSWIIPDTFVINYVALTTFGLDTFVHAPLATQWLPPLQRFYEGVCGEQMAGHVSAAYCMDYTMSPAVHNGDGTLSGGNIGANINGTDASDFGNLTPQTSLLAGGKLSQDGGPYYTVSVGDHVKIENGPYFGPAFTVDQLPGNQWFEVMGPVDNSAGTFYVKCPIGHAVDTTCPTPGAAFTGFTRGGVPLVESGELLVYRLNYNPPTGYVGNYARYGGQTLGLLKVLGQNVTNAISIFNARGGPGSFVPQYPIQWLDDTIVVPGLP